MLGELVLSPFLVHYFVIITCPRDSILQVMIKGMLLATNRKYYEHSVTCYNDVATMHTQCFLFETGCMQTLFVLSEIEGQCYTKHATHVQMNQLF